MWTTILNIILTLLLLLGLFSQHSLKSMFEQIGKNLADIFQNRDKEYESEKGRNLATKEDIEEITQKIEQVKAEISFKNQWKHEHIQKREERLIRILHLANKISMAQNRIIIKSRNAYNVEKLFGLIDEIDTYAVELTNEGNMLIADFTQFREIDPATKLTDTAVLYAAELSYLANNVANSLQGSDFFKNRALEKEDAASVKEMQNSILMNQQAQNYVTAPLKYKDATKEAIKNYILWLEQLYGKGVIANYQISEITTEQV